MSYTGLVYKVWGKYEKCVIWNLFNVVCLSVENHARERKSETESCRGTKREIKRRKRNRDPGDYDVFLLWLMSGPFQFQGPVHASTLSQNRFQLLAALKQNVTVCKVCGLLENNNFKMSLRCLEIHWFGLRLVWMMIHPFLLNLIMHCAVEIPWLNGSQVSQFDCWNRYLLKQVPLFQINMLIYGPQSVILRKVGVFLVQMNECVIAYYHFAKIYQKHDNKTESTADFDQV